MSALIALTASCPICLRRNRTFILKRNLLIFDDGDGNDYVLHPFICQRCPWDDCFRLAVLERGQTEGESYLG